MPALYSDFRSQRTLNPDGYIANISAWKRGLSGAALAGRAPSKSANRNHFTLELDDALLGALESKQFGRPLALGTVLHEAVASGELVPLPSFTSAKESVYHKSWGSIPWNVMSWGLRQAGLDRGVSGLLGNWAGGGGDSIPKGQFVVLQNLEAAAKAFTDAVADRAASPFERTFSKAHFRRTFEGSLLPPDVGKQRRLSETDLDVLVRFLSRDKGILATDGHTIKIRASSTTAAESPTTITEEDSAIASLKELTEDLTHQTDALTRRVDELNVTAQDAVRRKNRVAALAALKSRKIAEAALAQRHATLSQLEEVAARLQQAADNVQMVRTMRASTAALRELNAAVGGADTVDGVLDALREQMGEVDEVGGVIAEVGRGQVDEVELDDELEAMLGEEREKEEKARRVEREARDAEEARRQLAELERLGPVPVGLPGENVTMTDQEKEKEKRPPTPATAAAEELGGLSLTN